jgi:anti-sigma regulatory factor (Ser/Thr protein kinase)
VPGVLGGAFRKIMPQRFDLAVGDLIVVHSDGITSHFDTLRARALDASNAASEVLAVHGRSYDDASCVVARVLPPLATVVRAEASVPCEEERELPIRVEGDVYVAATAARAFARDAGLSPRGQWEVGIAASELAQNAVKYGVEGRLLFKRIARGEVILEVADRGPGFGASAERPGLREGLAAVRRLMDSCEVWSTPLGSRVVARKKEPAVP